MPFTENCVTTLNKFGIKISKVQTDNSLES